MTTAAECGETCAGPDQAPPPQMTHGFPTEWCIDDERLDTSGDRTDGESEGRFPAPSSTAPSWSAAPGSGPPQRTP